MLLTLGDSLGFHAVEDDSDGAHPRGLPCQGHAPQCDSQSKSAGALILFSYCLFLQRLDLLQMSRPVFRHHPHVFANAVSGSRE